jgi:hypothetical protein
VEIGSSLFLVSPTFALIEMIAIDPSTGPCRPRLYDSTPISCFQDSCSQSIVSAVLMIFFFVLLLVQPGSSTASIVLIRGFDPLSRLAVFIARTHFFFFLILAFSFTVKVHF